ncbi:uncharacterized protein ISCGN_017121 [Ixodes scapularis]
MLHRSCPGADREPSRRSCGDHGSMASVSDDPISLWLKLGALDKLEQALLDGYGEQLLGKTSRIPQVARFLKQVPMLQAQIEQIHEDTMQGKLDEIRSLLGSRQLAFCRDQQGASPLHKAVLFQQRNMVTFFVENFPGVMHARDHQGRTPLHYAAVLQDNWEIYNMLKAAGSDENATDVYGHTPDFYLEAPGELTLEQLKEGVSTPRSKKSKHRRKKSEENATGATFRGYSAKPAGLKVQIREVIAQGNLEALEELVLHGHGDKLLGEISPNPVVQEFLDTVPGYMEQINDVHRAVVRGRLREVQTLMNHKSLSLARDSLGATPIHKAIMHGHHEIVQHLAENFVQCLSAKDLDGRTPLHYASAMKDGRKMYNMLLLAGSPTTIVDSKGKTAEYYLQYPDKLNMEQIIKRNQLANATYLGNTISRLKTLAPSFQKNIVNMHERYHLTNAPPNGNQEGFFNGDEENRSEGSEEAGDDKTAAIASQAEALKKVMMRSKPILPPVILPRLEVTSANIRKWIDEHDLKKLEGAVFEGYGERLARETSTGHQEVEQYLRKDVPRMLERIQAIHRAVADDDVPGLESQLDSADYALARDRMGMTPLHRAVVLGRQDAVKLLVDKFPETINARDREGRTALHYAAAASRRSGRSHLYRLLLQNGSDPRIRDNRGKSSEFYKTHHLPMPPEIGQLGPSAKDKARSRSEPPGSRPRKHSFATSLVVEKLSSALQKGDPAEIRELVLEGHGRHLLGRTSWNEEVRQLLKALPTHLQNVNATHEAISRGDVAKLKELAALDETYLKTRSDDGCHPIHAAIENRQLEAVRLILEKFPACINLKASHGRNPLHLAALRRDTAIYKLLVECGADPKALDQKGKTAEYYLKSRRGRSKSSASPNPPRERSPPKEIPFSSKTTKVETIAVPTMEKETLSSGAELQRPRENVEEKHESDKKAVPNREDANAEQNATAADGNSPEESDSGDAEDRLNELIDLWIKDGDLLRLEHVVIAGQGERLLNKTSEDKQVQEFLSLVPAYMERIRSVHEAVVRGNLAEVRQVLTRKRFALSRDHLGASPLHLAVLHGHTDVLNYIVDKFPETLDGPDNEGRTPLHYAAVVMEAQNYFDILKKAGADDTIKDKMGHTPEFYVKNPKELTIRDLLEGYQTTNDEEKSATADVWKRPPTPPEDAEAEETAAVQAQPDAPVVSVEKSVPASVPDQDKTTDQKQAPSKEPGKVQAPVEKPADASVQDLKQKLPAQVLPSAPPIQESVKEEIKEKVKVPLPESTKMPEKLPSEALKPEPAKGIDPETTKVLVLAPPAPAQDPRPAQEKEPLIVPVVLPTKALSKGNQVPVQEPPLVPDKVESQALQSAKLRPTAEEAAQVQGSTQLPEKVPQAEAHLPETPRAHAPSTREVLKSAEVRQLAQSMLREGRTVEEGRYLTDAVGDVLSRGLLAVSKQRPADPVNFLVSWFKEQVPQKPAPVAKALPDPSTVTKERSISSRSNTNSSSATSEGSLKKAGFTQPFTEDVVDEDADHYRDDHTKLKDEEGQTVLHFAASHSHSEGCFYALIRQGHVLLAERDGRYRTARDVAREASQRDNLLDLDQYVLDAFLERRSDLLRALAHQGYDQLLNAVDKHGRDVTSIVTQFEMTDMQSLMHELAYFFKARDELHAFVRNGYLEGLQNLIKKDAGLVTAKSQRGRCALHVAVLVENPEIIEHLIRAKRDAVHVADNMGRTPLHYAMAMPHVTTIGQILVQNGASRTARDVKMRTPSYFFIYKQEIMKLKEEETAD